MRCSSTKNTLFSAEVIFNSFVYLYKSAVDLNDKVGYNEYYIGALNWVTKLYYLNQGNFIGEYFIQLNIDKFISRIRYKSLYTPFCYIVVLFLFWYFIDFLWIKILITFIFILKSINEIRRAHDPWNKLKK